jgi:hypothetical protein
MIRLPRRPVRYALLLAVAVVAALGPTAPASAAAPVVDLDCTITVTVDAHPGVDTQLRHIVFTSRGLTGTAECTGTIDGQTVTGPGSFAITDTTLTNCEQTSGSGSFVLRIPTTGGIKTVAGRTAISLIDGVVTHTGDLTGTSTIIATVGDCVTTPVTQATAVLTVHVT